MPAFATPFINELRTNYVPSSLDREHINALLIEPNKRLLELNDKVSEMERIMDALKQERDSLDDEIQEHTRLLAPFRRFPDDMLREIFLACLPDQHNAIMSSREAPLVLGLVCRRWRSLVYSTPSLWASLHIPYPSPMSHPPPMNDETRKLIEADQEKLRKHQIAVKDWLLRSGACPLSISFFCVRAESAASSVNLDVMNVIQSYLDIILSVSHRWNTLELYIPSGNLFNRIASIPKTSVPVLKHLRLSFSRSMSIEEGLEWSSSSFLNATSLYSLNIALIPFRPSSISSGFWSELSYLTLDNMMSFSPNRNMATIEEAYYIFSRCRRLVHCSLDIFDRPDATSPSGVISLPYLKSLSIVESCQLLSTLFECFTDVSGLRGVSYHSKLRPSNHRKSPLITLLARTNHHLNHLTTDLNYYTYADLSTIFALVPNLTHFTDENSRSSRTRNPNLPESFNIGKVFLDLFIPLGSGPTYCSRLQTLKLKKSQKLSDRDVLSFLQRRMGASKYPGVVEPLREFRAVLMPPAELDIPALLAEYVEDGQLTLNIAHASGAPSFRSFRSQIHPRVGLVKRTVPDIIQACHS